MTTELTKARCGGQGSRCCQPMLAYYVKRFPLYKDDPGLNQPWFSGIDNSPIFEAFSAMTTSSKVVLFGDQTVDPCPLIKQLCRQSTHSLTLQSFFRRSYSAIRQELAISELSDRSRFPSFDSILALAETYSQGTECDEAITSVLLCIAQLGLLLS